MKQVKIMSGVSGSGKSTYAHKLVSEKEPRQKFRDGGQYGENCLIVSADNFFLRTGDYKFDPSKLSEAHAYCFREFLRAMQPWAGFPAQELIILDNCNTEVFEIAPYVLASAAFGYDCEIITIVCEGKDLCRAANRNTHRVPFASCLAQARRLQARVLPRYWEARQIPFAG